MDRETRNQTLYDKVSLFILRMLRRLLPYLVKKAAIKTIKRAIRGEIPLFQGICLAVILVLLCHVICKMITDCLDQNEN